MPRVAFSRLLFVQKASVRAFLHFFFFLVGASDPKVPWVLEGFFTPVVCGEN